MTHIKMWFLEQMKELVDLEEEILKYQDKELPDDLLIQAKKDGLFRPVSGSDPPYRRMGTV